MVTNTAKASWDGTGSAGSGIVSTRSDALDATPYTLGARFRGASGATPEELRAAAHASCYSMSVAYALEQAGFESERVEVAASVTLQEVDGGFLISGIHLELEASVPGMERDAFEELAEAAKALCPLSMALHAVEMTLDIRLA